MWCSLRVMIVLRWEKLLKHVSKLKKGLWEHYVSPLRLQSMVTTMPQYDKTVKLFEAVSARVARLDKITAEERGKLKEKLKT